MCEAVAASSDGGGASFFLVYANFEKHGKPATTMKWADFSWLEI